MSVDFWKKEMAKITDNREVLDRENILMKKPVLLQEETVGAAQNSAGWYINLNTAEYEYYETSNDSSNFIFVGANRVEYNSEKNELEIRLRNTSSTYLDMGSYKDAQGFWHYNQEIAAKLAIISAEAAAKVPQNNLLLRQNAHYEFAIIGATVENKLFIDNTTDAFRKIYGKGTIQSIISAPDQYHAAQYTAYREFKSAHHTRFTRFFDQNDPQTVLEYQICEKLSLTAAYNAAIDFSSNIANASIKYLRSTGLFNSHLILAYTHLPNGSSNVMGNIGRYIAYDYKLAPTTRIAQTSIYYIEELGGWQTYREYSRSQLSFQPSLDPTDR